MSAPELFEPTGVQPRPGRPVGRIIIAADHDPAEPAFFEWELRGQEWSDEHPHDEYAYVLEGELHVTVDGTTVIAAASALVRVPGGARGHYAAPVFARILSVYGPRPAGPHDPRGLLRALDASI